ncbi:MAG: hypothetical protein A2494_02890 [Candidatus Lloydbacteria bacterium RIFOXYC12_FULL_46_25]|uniref:Uncharacterized protein n=1 Tax=Candidatus Lloydbacteria bacterium RIFOXYC12_FULL_46_25 TaxID=1798670 RepID=A0A1G2DSR7_9BACT|nr:MAG: hypothetical protein A2494_02890 [Candidatus Lloydbacteria bacterium RIFOXYC12_FULL_46_25]
MATRKAIQSRKLIRGTRAHALAVYLMQPQRLYEYCPFLHIPFARLYAGTHTRSDLDVIEDYVRQAKETERKFADISGRLELLLPHS